VAPLTLDDDLILEGDNLDVLPRLPDGAFDLVYIDPPFNTGRAQVRDLHGYDDAFDDYPGFLRPRLEHARRLLADHGTLYVHLDPREAHYVKVLLDELFGRACFLNEIVWAYDYGGRPKRRWPAKHDTILVYVKDRRRYHFDLDAVEREPYMAPGLQTPERIARGKSPTDTWWHTIVPTTSREKTGYPTQKPRGSCAASWRRRRGPTAGAWTSSPGRARSARSAASSGAASCSWTATRTRSRWRVPAWTARAAGTPCIRTIVRSPLG
jgi:site-specific DNA-methyltransferase (adenine-specific)